MARLQHALRNPAVRDKPTHIRYVFDVKAVVRFFGGLDRLQSLSRQFGVPLPHNPTANTMAALLELGERAGMRFDAYNYVVQVR